MVRKEGLEPSRTGVLADTVCNGLQETPGKSLFFGPRSCRRFPASAEDSGTVRVQWTPAEDREGSRRRGTADRPQASL